MRRWGTAVLVLWIAAAVSLAQGPDSTWSRTFGTEGVENAFSVAALADGGSVLAGSRLPFGSARYDFWLVRADANGDSLWSRSYGYASAGEYCMDVAPTADGGFALCGTTEAFTQGFSDMWLVKIDANGTQQWNRRYGREGYDWCFDVVPASDGGYFLAGWTDPDQDGIGDGYVVRAAANGDTLWTRRLGFGGEDRFYAARQTSDGGFVAAGRITVSGAFKFWLARWNASGQLQWQRTYGGAADDRCHALEIADDGGFILAGVTSSFGLPGENVWIVRTAANGDSLWSRTFGGVETDRAWSVVKVEGGFTVAGQTASGSMGAEDFWVLHLDDAGIIQWNDKLGGEGSDICYAIASTPDGGYLLAGQTASFGAGADDMWLVRLGSAGELPVPEGLVILPEGDHLRLFWNNDSNPYYRVYSDTSSTGDFTGLVGSTPDTTIFLHNGSVFRDKQFFRVVGSLEP